MSNWRDQRPAGTDDTPHHIQDGTLNLQPTGCPLPLGRVPFSIFGLFTITIDTDARHRECLTRKGLLRHEIAVPGLLERNWGDDAIDRAIDVLDKLAEKIPIKGGPKAIIGRLAARGVVKLPKVFRDAANLKQLQEAEQAYRTLLTALTREIEQLGEENLGVKNMFDAAIEDGRMRTTYTEAERVNLLAALEPRQDQIREAWRIQRELERQIELIDERIRKLVSQ